MIPVKTFYAVADVAHVLFAALAIIVAQDMGISVRDFWVFFLMAAMLKEFVFDQLFQTVIVRGDPWRDMGGYVVGLGLGGFFLYLKSKGVV